MRVLLSLLAFLCLAGAATAQKYIDTKLPLKTPFLLTTAKWTTFKPETHGYKFNNTFQNNFISELDFRTSGLCGGMIWSAMDYWTAGRTIPQQTYEPPEGAPLRDFIYNRQVNSVVDNIDKIIELEFNPGGARNDEFWRWGLEGKPGGRIDELRKLIDAGKPAPLLVKGCSEGCFGDHQVLAIGYDLGRYKGDLGEHIGDVKIYVYDPNFSGRTMTLVADAGEKVYRYVERPDVKWRTYFVDSKYRSQTPPNVPLHPHEVLLVMATGEDDLRGGNDNVHAILKIGAQERRFNNVNRGKRWISNTTNIVSLPLPESVAFASITGLRLETTFGGGVGGDNWDLKSLTVESSDRNGRQRMFSRSGSPLVRFTGDKKNETWAFGAALSELVVTFFTGDDDLRGGNDNVHFVLRLSNGQERPFRNVNGGRKWADRSSTTVHLPVPADIAVSAMSGFRIETTFGGGMGGDNWNLNGVDVVAKTATGDTCLHSVRGGPLKRFTGSDKTLTAAFNRCP